ncbi:MAG TPA: hypothetical protein VGE52_00090 [Pirellulales bacterium]
MLRDVDALLGHGFLKTIFSDELWRLKATADSHEVRLEAEFQSDAPNRTGWPDWTNSEFCISRDAETAVCRIHYDDPASLLAANRPSFVPELVWEAALAECRRLS